MKMLFLDFCNVEEWSLGAISELYKENKIVHTKHGKLRGWEDFCKTKHDERRFYFEDIPPEKTLWVSISPSQPKFSTLWEMLVQSQQEYRAFLDRCIKLERLDLDFINEKFERIINQNPLNRIPIRFVRNPKNEWIPKISYNLSYLLDIEAYVEWEIIEIALHQVGSTILGHVKKCKDCKKYFFCVRSRKREYCSKKCHDRFHNKEAIKSGKLREYMRKARSEGKYP